MNEVGGQFAFPISYLFGDRSVFVVLLLYVRMWYLIHLTACRGGRLLECKVKLSLKHSINLKI